jgi:hypothetical protein
MTKKLYKLIIYLNNTSLKKSDLVSKVRKVVRKHLNNIKLSIKTVGSEYYLLELKGSLNDIDSCHLLIQKNIIPEIRPVQNSL